MACGSTPAVELARRIGTIEWLRCDTQSGRSRLYACAIQNRSGDCPLSVRSEPPDTKDLVNGTPSNSIGIYVGPALAPYNVDMHGALR